MENTVVIGLYLDVFRGSWNRLWSSPAAGDRLSQVGIGNFVAVGMHWDKRAP